MSLNTSQLTQDMLAAFQGALAKKWPEIKEYAETEAKKMAQSLAMIEVLSVSGKINAEQATLHLEIQKNATRMVFLTLEGLGMLAAEAAINAALNVVKESVNTALGFVLIN
ncbi:MAG: hypothetical protein HY253_01140 [Burkholderiales bacterium]|nr:hypothetical protein [Burkholderiales bacterium]